MLAAIVKPIAPTIKNTRKQVLREECPTGRVDLGERGLLVGRVEAALASSAEGEGSPGSAGRAVGKLISGRADAERAEGSEKSL